MKKTLILISITATTLLFTKCTETSNESMSSENTVQDTSPSEINTLTESQKSVIKELIKEVKKEDFNTLAERFDYPFYREQTGDTIQNAGFMQYELIMSFNSEYRKLICSTKIDKKWHTNESGDLIFNKSDFTISKEGKFLSLNRLSFWDKLQLDKKAKMELERAKLPDTLKEFKEPELSAFTENYQIRIDKMADETYRFASWRKDDTLTNPPTVLIYNGQYESNGYGGNYDLTFIKDNYTYTYFVNKIGERGIPIGGLTIHAGENEILFEEAIPPSIEDFWDEFITKKEDKIYCWNHIKFPFKVDEHLIDFDEFSKSNYQFLTLASLKNRSSDVNFYKWDWNQNELFYDFINNYINSNHIYVAYQEPYKYQDGFQAYFLLEKNQFYFFGVENIEYGDLYDDEAGC